MVWNKNLSFFLIYSSDDSVALETNMNNNNKIYLFNLAIKIPI